MKIKLKTLTLSNFKGIKSKTIDFSDKTIISGRNETGKTTVFNAYMWLLWGKDSQNRKDYEIKPYDESGENKHNLESTVEGILDVDGKEVTLKRVYKEKWTKKKGSNNAEFTGHTTDLYINDVPKKLKDYTEFIENLVTEDEFNLLSNPLYFNENIDNKKRREILLGLVEDVTPEDVVKSNPKLGKLDLENYQVDELRAMAKSTSKKINDELKEIPARIDELEGMKTDEDFEEVKKEKEEIEEKIQKIDEALAETKGISEVIKEKSSLINDYEKQKRDLVSTWEDENRKGKDFIEDKKREIRRKIDTADFEIENKKSIYKNKLKTTADKKEDIKIFEDEVAKLRKEWVETNNKFYEGDFKCPTCGQDLPENQVEEIKNKFNLDKSKKLEDITIKAKAKQESIDKLKSETEKNTKELEDISSEVTSLREKQKSYKEELKEIKDFVPAEKPAEIEEIDSKIKAIEKELEEISNNDNSSLLEDKKDLNSKLDILNGKLSNVALNESIETKIKAYMDKEKELSRSYQEQEEILGLCDDYITAYVDLVSSKINDLFEFAEFKLFETQINGGIKETAETVYKGVPYGTLNNASTYNIGLDIINTLNKKFNKYLPIFIDNAESVNELLKVDSQVIELRVSEDKNLRIEK